MKVFDEFATELAGIDPRLTIIQNPNIKQMANILLDGINICSIPSGEIKDEADPSYTIQFPNGFVSKHRSRKEAISIVRSTLDMIETKDGKEIFYAKE